MNKAPPQKTVASMNSIDHSGQSSNPSEPLISRIAVFFFMWQICTFGQTLTSIAQEIPPSKSLRIAGYLPNYRFAEFDEKNAYGLTDILLFSVEPQADGTLDLTAIQNCPWEKLERLKKEKNLRLSVTIGGWDRSQHFAKVATTPHLRKTFIQSITQLVDDRQLQGVDLDWEHPHSTDEQIAYGTLLQELRNKLAPQQTVITVTIAGWQQLPKSAIDAIDYVQLMAYDHDQKHSTLDKAQAEVESLINRGIPRQKIVLGLPFYGRHIRTREAFAYQQIQRKYAPLPSVDLVDDIYFNGPHTIREKVKFTLNHQLAGIMIWELGQDTSGQNSLLNAAVQATTDRP